MPEVAVRNGWDSSAIAARPGTNYQKNVTVALGAGISEGYFFFALPAPRGAVVTSAVLRMHTSSAWPACTIALAKITSRWSGSSVSWANRPTFTWTDAIGATFSARPARSLVEIDVTAHVQAAVNGGGWYGWRATSNATTAHGVHSLEAATASLRPTLVVSWSDAPHTPTSLVPGDGATVSIAKPTLSFNFADVSGDVTLGAVQVQVDPGQNGTAPAWDSGTVVTTAPELNLATTTYAGLAAGASTSWRVRVRDGAGLWSDWSTWRSFSRAALPTLVVSNPSNGADPIVTETTPPIVWSLTGATQSAWQVRVSAAADSSKILHDSGKRPGSQGTYSLPPGVLVDDAAYRVEVRSWDGVATRIATPGDPGFTSVSRTFRVADDPSVTGISSFNVEAVEDTPWVALEWYRANAPDSYEVLRNGVVIAHLLPDETVDGPGGANRWVDYSAAPHHEHTYAVKPVVNGARGPGEEAPPVLTRPVGIWLADPERGITVALWGDEDGDWLMEDDATVYTPFGASDVIRIVTGQRGYAGSLSGSIMDGFGRTFAEHEAALLAIKGAPARTVRLVAGDENLAAIVGNLTIAPSPVIREGQLLRLVSFEFWQVGARF